MELNENESAFMREESLSRYVESLQQSAIYRESLNDSAVEALATVYRAGWNDSFNKALIYGVQSILEESAT